MTSHHNYTRNRLKKQVGLCYAIHMANIKPVVPPQPAPEPPAEAFNPHRSKITSDPQVAKKHMLQFISDEEGHNWRCLCGHVYPRPPIEVLLTNQLDAWLNPLVEEHERE